MQRIAVIGAHGQLGTDLCHAYRSAGHEVVELGQPDLDVAGAEDCARAVDKARPDVLINTAAMHHLDKCERDPARAHAVNALGPRHLAQLARERGFVLLHVSTDYVFDGTKGAAYVETDAPRPLNVYGNSKLSGEYYVRTVAPKHFVVRVSGLFGRAPCKGKTGANFVQNMLKLARERGEVKVVDSEWLCPTHTLDAAQQILALTGTRHWGLYHAVSREGCSWYEFARTIFDLTGTAVKLHVAGPNDFPAKVPRPADSRLENAALQALGLNRMPHWKEGLQRYLNML